MKISAWEPGSRCGALPTGHLAPLEVVRPLQPATRMAPVDCRLACLALPHSALQ